MARTPARLPNGTRISDHVTLGVLTATIPAALIDAVLADTGRQSRRQRQLPARLMVYYVIALALYVQASYGEVLRCLLEGLRWLRLAGTDPDLADKSAITRARTGSRRPSVRTAWSQRDNVHSPTRKRLATSAWLYPRRLRTWRVRAREGRWSRDVALVFLRCGQSGLNRSPPRKLR